MGEVCLPAYGDKVVCFVLNWKRDLLKKKKIFKLFKGLKQAKMPRGLIPHQKNWMNILSFYLFIFKAYYLWIWTQGRERV